MQVGSKPWICLVGESRPLSSATLVSSPKPTKYSTVADMEGYTVFMKISLDTSLDSWISAHAQAARARVSLISCISIYCTVVLALLYVCEPALALPYGQKAGPQGTFRWPKGSPYREVNRQLWSSFSSITECQQYPRMFCIHEDHSYADVALLDKSQTYQLPTSGGNIGMLLRRNKSGALLEGLSTLTRHVAWGERGGSRANGRLFFWHKPAKRPLTGVNHRRLAARGRRLANVSSGSGWSSIYSLFGLQQKVSFLKACHV